MRTGTGTSLRRTIPTLSSHNKGSLELHLEQILKSNENAFDAYKKRVINIYDLSKSPQGSIFNFHEKDSAIRFEFARANNGFGKLYFIFEVGLINPRIRWRHLIRSREGFGPTILTQRASFLPAYSFGLDRTLSIVNWGDRQFVLDPENLKKMNLQSFFCTVENCAACEVSSANLLWPKGIDRVLENQSLENMTKNWIINSLLPPKIGNRWDSWDESPFVVIGDTSVEALTLHKTIVAVDRSTITETRSKDHVTAKVSVLDRDFLFRNVTCEILVEHLDTILKDPVIDVLLVKRSMLSKNNLNESSITLYPFEAPPIMKKEIPGMIVTAVSIASRSLYLNKEDSSSGIERERIRQLVTGILSQNAFSKYEWTEVGMKLLGSDEGLDIIASSLGVYLCNETIGFIHPAIV